MQNSRMSHYIRNNTVTIDYKNMLLYSYPKNHSAILKIDGSIFINFL